MRPFDKERRLHPRINKQLPLNIVANGFDFSTTTENISCLGAYCHIDKYIPPFTKIMIRLNLPLKSASTGSSVECKGVVVRSEDTPEGGFNVAIFFNRISEPQKQKITQYISQFLPQN